MSSSRRGRHPSAARTSEHHSPQCVVLNRILPWISAGLVVVLAASLALIYVDNNDDTTASANLDSLADFYAPSYQKQQEQRRFLQEIIAVGPDINDDITRDETCKQYMNKFLNGTTDFKDECQGMYNAYEAADCAQDTHTILQAKQRKKKHKKKRHTDATDDDKLHPDTNSTDDDVLIDDFYEHWECCSSIYEYYNTHCHESEMDSQRLLGIVSVLVVCSIIKSIVHQMMGLEFVPDAAIYVLVGAVTGAVCRIVAPDVVAQRLAFDNDLFLHILLPPIIFQAALKIDKRSFRRDLFPSLSFAVLGTVMSTVAIGLITYYMTRLGASGTRLPFLDSLLFGSLISSIDPVATLGILSSVGVSQRDTLYTLIFSESLMNDGVAIVLFDTLVKHLGDKTVVQKTTAVEVLEHFLGIAFGSMAIGCLCGGVCTLYFYNLWGKHTAVTEVAIFFSWALIPFYLSDMLGGSGIIAIMTMGFFLDFYVIGGHQSEEGEWMDFMQLRCLTERARSEGDLLGATVTPEAAPEPSRCDHFKLSWFRAFSGRGHILSKSRHHVYFVAEVLADIMETAIFAYLGLFLFNDTNGWDFKLNSIAIFGCVTSRIGVVVAISMLVNLFVLCDVEVSFSRCCRGFRRIFSELNSSPEPTNPSVRTTMSVPLLSQYDRPPSVDDDDEDDDEDDPESRVNKKFLDIKTQTMLVLAGVRGAVSFALVANIPLYNTVTKRGSQFKPELKSMTSSSIVFTLFVFGALTYFIVRKEQTDPSRERIVGAFTHRMSSRPLASDNEGEDDSDMAASDNLLLEMETEVPPASARRTRFAC